MTKSLPLSGLLFHDGMANSTQRQNPSSASIKAVGEREGGRFVRRWSARQTFHLILDPQQSLTCAGRRAGTRWTNKHLTAAGTAGPRPGRLCASRRGPPASTPTSPIWRFPSGRRTHLSWRRICPGGEQRPEERHLPRWPGTSVDSAGSRVEDPGLRRTRRAGFLRIQFQQPQQPGILGLQLLHLVLQRSQFSIQDTSLHACHLPAGAASSPAILSPSEPLTT